MIGEEYELHHEENRRQSHNVAKSKILGTTVADQNCMHEEN